MMRILIDGFFTSSKSIDGENTDWWISLLQGKDIEQKCEEMVDDDAADMMASIGQAIAKQLCIDVGACSGPSPPPPPPGKK